MATITTAQYLDDGIARTAGEVMTVNDGGSLTIRTDTRVHANAPAGMTGTLGSITVNAGTLTVDGTKVRWVAYDSGSGNVPAIGTLITQGGVSGYLLGVWVSIATAPTAVGSAMPTYGFLKFREVTGGSFAIGVLTGIGANATEADRAGWIEIAHDQSRAITIPRLGSMIARGEWFYLDNAAGVRGQVVQTPTNGGGVGSQCVGFEVETSAGSGIYEKYAVILPIVGAWNTMMVPVGGADRRQKFAKDIGNGQFQLGETSSMTGTYTTISQSGTYASNNTTNIGYYVYNNELYIDNSTVYILDGETYVQFTSGGLNGVTGTFDFTRVSNGVIKCPYIAANTSGVCTYRNSMNIAFTAHKVCTNDVVYVNFTSGAGVSGYYQVYAVTDANNYRIRYTGTATISGNCTVYTGVMVTTPSAHGMVFGQGLTFSFGNALLTDGDYRLTDVPSTTTFKLHVAPNAVTSGSLVANYDIGFIPEAGCKIRIPNIIYRDALTTSRNLNVVNTPTSINRTALALTGGGKVDMDKVSAVSLTIGSSKAYSLKYTNVHTADVIACSDVATSSFVDNCIVTTHYTSLAQTPYAFTASRLTDGDVISNNLFVKAKPSSIYSFVADIRTASVGFLFDNNIVINTDNNSPSTDANTFTFGYGGDCGFATISNNKFIGQVIQLTYNSMTQGNSVLNNDISLNVCCISNSTRVPILSVGMLDSVVDGVTFGFNNEILGQIGKGSSMISTSKSSILRNVGSIENPVAVTSFCSNLTTPSSIAQLSSYGKIQRCYIEQLMNVPITDSYNYISSVAENIHVKNVTSPTTANLNNYVYTNNILLKGVSGTPVSFAYAGVYGTNVVKLDSGLLSYIQVFQNEPTGNALNYFTVVQGTPQYTGAASLLLPNAGDCVIYESPFLIKGITNFIGYKNPLNNLPTFTNYRVECAIDNGAGYGNYIDLYATPLTGQAVNVDGFLIKFKITKILTNTAALGSFWLMGDSTWETQTAAMYPLDLSKLTVNSAIAFSRMKVSRVDTGEIIATTLITGTSGSVEVEYAGEVEIELRKGNGGTYYKPWVTRGVAGSKELIVTALQQEDL